MPKKENATAELTCGPAVIHYLYTFLFSPLFGLDESLSSGKTQSQLLRTVRPTASSKSRHLQAHWGSREMEEKGWQHDLLDPFLFLRSPYIELTTDIQEIELRSGVGKDFQFTKRRATLEERLVIYPSGQGFVDFRLTIPLVPRNIRLNKKNIVNAATLGTRRPNGRTRAKSPCNLAIYGSPREDSEVFLFHRFWKAVCTCRDILVEADTEKKEIEWIDVKEFLVGNFDADHHPSAEIVPDLFALPYPVLIGELAGEDYEVLFSNLDNQNPRYSSALCSKLLRDLLTIIYRSQEWENPDESFARDQLGLTDKGIPNMCSIQDMFIYLYSRLCVAFSPKLGLKGNEITEQPGCYIEEAMVETISFLRMQWHSYAVNNLRLDRLLSKVLSQFQDLAKAVKEAKADESWRVRRTILAELAEKQEELIKTKSAVIFALQDPITARIGSQSMSTIFEKGLHAFRIDRLRATLIGKMEELGRLYEDITTFKGRSEARILDEMYEGLRHLE